MTTRLMGLDPAVINAPVRPLRYYRITVPHWSDIHDRVVDEAAHELLGVDVLLSRRTSPVELFVAEPPEAFVAAPYEVRRWQMLVALLVSPDLAGRWQRWFEATLDFSWSRSMPAGMTMRVTTQEEFDTAMSHLEAHAATSGLPAPSVLVRKQASYS